MLQVHKISINADTGDEGNKNHESIEVDPIFNSNNS